MTSETGSWGVSSKTVTIWPALWVRAHFAGQLDRDPELGFADHHVEGYQGVGGVLVGLGHIQGAAAAFLPAAAWSTCTVPTLEASGQPSPGPELALSRARSSSLQAPSPSAREGLRVTPLGRITSARFRSEPARPLGFSIPSSAICRLAVERRGRGGAIGRGLGFQARGEAERAAAAKALGVGRFGGVVGEGAFARPAGEDPRGAPGVHFPGAFQRPLAGARGDQEGDFADPARAFAQRSPRWPRHWPRSESWTGEPGTPQIVNFEP